MVVVGGLLSWCRDEELDGSNTAQNELLDQVGSTHGLPHSCTNHLPTDRPGGQGPFPPVQGAVLTTDRPTCLLLCRHAALAAAAVQVPAVADRLVEGAKKQHRELLAFLTQLQDKVGMWASCTHPHSCYSRRPPRGGGGAADYTRVSVVLHCWISVLPLLQVRLELSGTTAELEQHRQQQDRAAAEAEGEQQQQPSQSRPAAVIQRRSALSKWVAPRQQQQRGPALLDLDSSLSPRSPR